jgi:hypothetical protein
LLEKIFFLFYQKLFKNKYKLSSGAKEVQENHLFFCNILLVDIDLGQFGKKIFQPEISTPFYTFLKSKKMLVIKIFL